MEKTATLNLRVNPTVKGRAEEVLSRLGIPMSTAIDMYLNQIYLTGGIPFAVTLPKAPNSINMDLMTAEELHAKLQRGYDNIEAGKVQNAASAFAKFKEELDMDILTRFAFRNIKQSEIEAAIEIEQICFPPNEACSAESMKGRIAIAEEFFLVAVDKETGKIAGFLNGIATDENRFRDEFFTDAGLHKEDGKNIMLLGLDVLPEYRRQGLGRELVYQYLKRERKNGRREVFLTCLQEKVEMYKKFGFADHGIANSAWGGEEWHEMSVALG